MVLFVLCFYYESAGKRFGVSILYLSEAGRATYRFITGLGVEFGRISYKNLAKLRENSWFTVAYPTSVQMANYKAGILGDPYKHLNAREHEKLEQRVWYYKKHFTIPQKRSGYSCILNFDGIDYFAKVWLNGIELGKHRGIFGGPVIDVSENLNYGGDNELIVEVISANYGKTSFNPNRPGNIVKGWFLMGGSAMEPFSIWAYGETFVWNSFLNTIWNVLSFLLKR